ncbi:DUF1918 domain-containing protein [Halobacteriales archaeon QS_4_70_19]|jgi:hypothetical protein|nr:MAG: DUF1918 domain-containing protein [Halobacteriales archaeon QS_4_70_19]
MSFEKGDTVVLHDEHSEYDGQVGEVTQVSETMFGDATYMIQFDDGQEAGISEDALEAAPDEDLEDDEAAAEE